MDNPEVRHHPSRLGAEDGVLSWASREPQGACSVGAESLDETELLWGYLVRQEGREGAGSDLLFPPLLPYKAK